MNVVDSSGWLEYFAAGPNADFFATAIQSTDKLLVPTISLYEVFKRVLQQRAVVALTASLALAAASVNCDLKIPMADSMMLATVRAHGATLWSQDSDFEGLADVRYVAKRLV